MSCQTPWSDRKVALAMYSLKCNGSGTRLGSSAQDLGFGGGFVPPACKSRSASSDHCEFFVTPLLCKFGVDYIHDRVMCEDQSPRNHN